MPWHQEDLELKTEKVAGVRFLYQEISFCRLNLQSDPELLEKTGLGYQWYGIGMIANLATESFFYRVRILDMIHMTMRDQEKIGTTSSFRQPLAGSSRGVEKDQTVWGRDQVSIGFEDTSNKGLKVDHIE
jgi:hypothetical protein